MIKKIRENRGLRVSAITVVVNLFLCVLKFIAGIIGHSGAMISDAVHSASDVLSTFVVMVGVYMSERETDSDHQYGHEKLECIAAIILAGVLFFTGGAIGLRGVDAVANGTYAGLAMPSAIALVAAIASILIKEWMYHYTKKAALALNSGALLADAWHHRSDALSSVGSFVGIGGAMLGFPIADSIAMIIIAAMIIKASYDIASDAVDKLVDKSLDNKTVLAIKELALSIEGVRDVDLIRTRLFGSKFYVDIEICCDGDMTLSESHLIAETVHDKIEQSFPSAKHCMVHVNPYEEQA